MFQKKQYKYENVEQQREIYLPTRPPQNPNQPYDYQTNGYPPSNGNVNPAQSGASFPQFASDPPPYGQFSPQQPFIDYQATKNRSMGFDRENWSLHANVQDERKANGRGASEDEFKAVMNKVFS
jgi:hypothetical protein